MDGRWTGKMSASVVCLEGGGPRDGANRLVSSLPPSQVSARAKSRTSLPGENSRLVSPGKV